MTSASIALAVLLVTALAYPFIAPRLHRERRGRIAHRGQVLHVYVNYDEDLHFEPRHEVDILPLARRELERQSYAPSSETVIVPRTFRRRIPGDERLRLWIPTDTSLRPVWICTWSGVEFGSVSSPEPSPELIRDLLEMRDSGRFRALADGELPDMVARFHCLERSLDSLTSPMPPT